MACCQEQTEERGMISLFNLNYMLGWWRPNLYQLYIWSYKYSQKTKMVSIYAINLFNLNYMLGWWRPNL